MRVGEWVGGLIWVLKMLRDFLEGRCRGYV